MDNKDRYSTDSTTPNSDPPELKRLLLECQCLLRVVASRPGAIKLLLGVHYQLEMFAGYKANRKSNRTHQINTYQRRNDRG